MVRTAAGFLLWVQVLQGCKAGHRRNPAANRRLRDITMQVTSAKTSGESAPYGQSHLVHRPTASTVSAAVLQQCDAAADNCAVLDPVFSTCPRLRISRILRVPIATMKPTVGSAHDGALVLGALMARTQHAHPLVGCWPDTCSAAWLASKQYRAGTPFSRRPGAASANKSCRSAPTGCMQDDLFLCHASNPILQRA